MKTRASARQPTFSRCPLVVLAVAFALGVLLASVSPRPPLAPCLGGGVCLSACAAFALFRKKQGASALLVVASFFGAGAAAFEVEEGRAGETRVRRLYERGQ